MSFDITTRAECAVQKSRVEPQLVLEIDGVPTLFSAVEISRLIRIGDAGLVIGNNWKIGGTVLVENQENIISFEGGSAARIEQQLQPDKGSVSSVSSIQIALNDKRLALSKVISPGVIIEEVLGVTATLWLGFKGTAFKEDYVQIFSGIIDDVESGGGQVKLNIAHPEQLKRQEIFTPTNVEVVGDLSDTQTTIPLVDASEMPTPIMGPSGVEDTAIKFHVKIGDEIIQYARVSGNNLIGCVRGSLGTLPETHEVDEGDTEPLTGKSLINLEDSAINCALKIMLSGTNGYFSTGIPAKRFVNPNPLLTVANSVFFQNVILNRDHGLIPGDFVTITGSPIPSNNCTLKPILDIVDTDSGSYAVISGVNFVPEPDSPAVASFRSQFDTLGYGLGLTPKQTDCSEHVYWDNTLLASFTYRFVFTDTINGKDFLDKEIYMPIGAFSIPRQGRVSMGYHVGPIARTGMKTVDKTNIKNPHKIKLRRTINKNFYNTIIYKFDKSVVDDKYASGVVQVSSDSKKKIKVGNKVLSVASSGLRRSLDGIGIAGRVANRYLSRYQFAAEFFESIELLFKTGFTIEPGDAVMFNPTDLEITDTVTGTRNKRPKLFTVINKKLDAKTGEATIALVDSNFDESERYGTVSPSSVIVGGTTTKITVRDSFGDLFPGGEYRKWVDYAGMPIIIHSPDWSFAERVTLKGINSANAYQFDIDPETPLSISPPSGYIIDIDNYPDNDDLSDNAKYKAVHAFIGEVGQVLSGISDTEFRMSDTLGAKIKVGETVRIHNADYSIDSSEVKVKSIVFDEGATNYIITVDVMGFTPDNTLSIDMPELPDGNRAYLLY